MTSIEDTIKHAEGAEGCGGHCSEEHHRQLAEWLRELQGYRELFGGLPDYSNFITMEEDGSVFQVRITTPDGETQAVLLKEAIFWQDPAEDIDPATGVVRKIGKRSFVMTGTVVEAR